MSARKAHRTLRGRKLHCHWPSDCEKRNFRFSNQVPSQAAKTKPNVLSLLISVNCARPLMIAALPRYRIPESLLQNEPATVLAGG